MPLLPNRTTGRNRRPVRADIEGLRGWLAAVIVLSRLSGVPEEGAPGVDGFFVISGFLITGLLVWELRSTGRVSIAAFFARRARRILPTAAAVLAVTVAATSVMWSAPRALRAGLDSLSALTLVENWHLIASRRSHLQPNTDASPVEHFWSLAVEGQFYVTWPLVIIGAALLVTRLGRLARLGPLLLITAAAAFIASGLYSTHATRLDPSAASVDTFARAWEFVPGIVAALVTHRVTSTPRWIRCVGLWLGIASTAAAFALVDPNLGFSGSRTLLVIVGTAFIVGFGTNTEGTATGILACAPARFVGRRAYPLYLWHFPAAVLIMEALGRTWWAACITLGATVLLSEASYHWIERRALRSSWLRGWEVPAGHLRRDRARRRLRERAGVSAILVVIAGSAVAQLAAPTRFADPSYVISELGR